MLPRQIVQTGLYITSPASPGSYFRFLAFSFQFHRVTYDQRENERVTKDT